MGVGGQCLDMAAVPCERDPIPIVLINYHPSYYDVEFSTENVVYNTLKFGTC